MTIRKAYTRTNERAEEMLQHIADGLQTWQVADKVKLTEAEVTNVLQHMRKNNGCATTLQLIVMALREGVVK